MQAPGFWDDQEAAARTSAAHARAQRKLKTFEELESEVGDLDELAEMAAEDEEMASELDVQLASVERRLAELEEARLFSGSYDAGDAVVSVHAGRGGPTPRTGPRSSCECTCAGRSGAASGSR